MSILGILAIIALVLAVAALVVGWVLDNAIVAFIALPLVLAAAILGASADQVSQDHFNEETVRICNEKGGVVSKDNHCFVNGKPVEFSPGIWQRNH